MKTFLLAADRVLLPAALIALVAAAACATHYGKNRKAMKTPPVLAKLEVPDRALLLYEQMVIDDPDRTGNSRFLFRRDGSFFSVSNKQLWVTDPGRLHSDDPALFWNTPFPAKPDRHLTPEQLANLEAALRRANFAALDRYYPATQRTLPLQVERWSAMVAEPSKPGSARAYTILVERKAAPPQLIALRKTISGLIADAPRTAP